jgi:hypothetical protein
MFYEELKLWSGSFGPSDVCTRLGNKKGQSYRRSLEDEPSCFDSLTRSIKSLKQVIFLVKRKEFSLNPCTSHNFPLSL